MNEREAKLVIGSLLHDIGKVCYRAGDTGTHSESGYRFLKERVHIQDEDILACVRYHHGSALRYAKKELAEDAPVWLTYFADNIAAAADRRESEEPEDGFDQKVPLASVFNILNHNHGKAYYAARTLDVEGQINYPTQEPVQVEDVIYRKACHELADHLKGIAFEEAYVNSLLTVMEVNFSYLPSSTSRRELSDISLYDHVKLTAALALCMEKYFAEKRF